MASTTALILAALAVLTPFADGVTSPITYFVADHAGLEATIARIEESRRAERAERADVGGELGLPFSPSPLDVVLSRGHRHVLVRPIRLVDPALHSQISFRSSALPVGGDSTSLPPVVTGSISFQAGETSWDPDPSGKVLTATLPPRVSAAILASGVPIQNITQMFVDGVRAPRVQTRVMQWANPTPGGGGLSCEFHRCGCRSSSPTASRHWHPTAASTDRSKRPLVLQTTISAFSTGSRG